MNIFTKLRKHMKTISIHKRAVFKWCLIMGIPTRGVLHDLSKYSIGELKICKYYTGTKSPHDTMRDIYGYSTSWYKHRNKNKHHWEYWIDSLENKVAVKMPYKYVIEMFCDYVGANYAYSTDRKNWNKSGPLKYFVAHDGPHRIIHPSTKSLITLLLTALSESDTIDGFIKWFRSERKTIKSLYRQNNNKFVEYSINKINMFGGEINAS